jgi:hypothetical protein
MQKVEKITESSGPNFVFCSMSNNHIFVHNQNGSVVCNISVPVSGGTLVGVDTDSTGAYICATASNHKVYVFKRTSPSSYSWSLSRIYGI